MTEAIELKSTPNKVPELLANRTPIEERRIKLLVVDPRMVIEFLLELSKKQSIFVPGQLDLPDDAVILGVDAELHSDSILIKVASREFEPVDQCCMYPKIAATFSEWVRRELVDPAELQAIKDDLWNAQQEIASLTLRLEDSEHQIGELS